MGNYLWLLGVLAAALLGGFVGGAPMAGLSLALLFTLTLIVMLPLTVGFAAMFTALAAVWAGNWLAPSGVRRRLLPIVGVTEATAAVVAALLLALILWLEGMGTFTLSLLLPLLISTVVVLALAATLATWRFRVRGEPDLWWDFLLTLGLLGLTALVVVWALAFAFLLGQVGV